VQGDLGELSRLSMEDLKETEGVGTAKAILIQAALEIGRRRRRMNSKDKPMIRSSKDAYELIASRLEDLPHEEFWVMYLNRANRLIHQECISRGGLSGTVVDNRIIFKIALQKLACAVILAHNHPSGNLNPSQSDLQLTKKLIQAGDWLEIKVMDHIIITESGYTSFADQGMMQ
jgi:DNA repair protein RadC